MAWSSGYLSPTYTPKYHLDEQASSMNNLFLTIAAQKTLYLFVEITKGKLRTLRSTRLNVADNTPWCPVAALQQDSEACIHPQNSEKRLPFLIFSLEGHL